ncbi:MAG: enoyl-CoA hydratase/isomerase family protein [Pseudomonadota bacterium]|nr:enoyl-CoA hydratase/isomerase family protein [Pseudomonadota bacterium]
MSYATLKLERRDAIEILSLNRPQALNALSPQMAGELTDYFTGLTSRLDVRVVILRGEGRLFCAGAELGTDAFAESGAGRPQRQMAMQRLYSGVVRAMRTCPQPIVALIHGAACGGGLSLALAADVRYAAPNARMNAAYIKIGLGGCDMGAGYLLPRLVGLSNASEFLLTGRFIDAERALRMGLVSEIAPEGELLDRGLQLAADMLKTAPMGLRLTKETLNAEIDAPSLEAALALEDRQQVLLLETADHREAVQAFLAKRAPVYKDA